MSSYISSNANRFYTALESAYGKSGIDHGRQPDSGGQAGNPAASGDGNAARQDGEPDIRRGAGRGKAAHDVRPADILDQLGQGDRRSRIRSAVRGGAWAAVPLRFGGGNGGVEHDKRDGWGSERRTD